MDSSNLRTDLLLRIEDGLRRIEYPDAPESLYTPYEYALTVGGKRIRPLMTLLASGMCGGETSNGLPAALSVEVLHNFTLVHDDIMDSADTRRGKPSVFKKWDENTAILSGDLMFAEAFRFLNFYGSSDEYSKSEYFEMNSTFIQSTITVCEGQAFDMEFVDRNDVSLDEYIQMISGKTAALLAGSLKMGGISAHADQEQLEYLFNLGMEMGIAFQIQDDLLDAIADPEKFGKRPGGDIFEGKKTYLTILALERANQSQQKQIINTLEDSNPTTDEVEEILALMLQLNVISDVQRIVSEHYSKCYQYLTHFNDTPYRQELQNLLIFLQNRDH